LDEIAKEAAVGMTDRIRELTGQGRKAGLVTDDWKDTADNHVEGIIVTLGDETFAYGIMAGGTEHHGIAKARDLYSNEDHNIQFVYVVTDDAGQFGRARRILALRHPHIIFLCCFAHQINLIVRQLLNASKFKTVVEQAIAAAQADNASSSKWMGILLNEMERYYGKKGARTIFSVGETRWNSTQTCFATQLRSKTACMRVAQDYEFLNGDK
jgi:hypothetical protein